MSFRKLCAVANDQKCALAFGSFISMKASLIMSLPRVLSIQSHTVFGFVGNKAATFPLQTMGFNVDCINTVSLSNHPAYAAGCKGKALEPDTLSDIISGLESNSLLNYDVVLTGYTRSEEHLEVIEQTVKKIRTVNPKVLYLCDPVLGDNGDYYVPSKLLDIYKEKLLPIANIVTPNMFESQVLSGMAIHTYADAIEACGRIHAMGPDICILTGLTLSCLPSDKLTSVISVKSWECLEKYKYHAHTHTPSLHTPVAHTPSSASCTSDDQVAYQVTFQKEAGYFAGCGDLLAALTVASTHYLRCAENFFPSSEGGIKGNVPTHTTQTLTHTHTHTHTHTSTLSLTPAVLGDILEHLVQSMSKVVTNTRVRGSRELSVLESRHVYEHHVTSMFGQGVYGYRYGLG
ncbi:pyridoxal kinase, partial [archaeon]